MEANHNPNVFVPTAVMAELDPAIVRERIVGYPDVELRNAWVATFNSARFLAIPMLQGVSMNVPLHRQLEIIDSVHEILFNNTQRPISNRDGENLGRELGVMHRQERMPNERDAKYYQRGDADALDQQLLQDLRKFMGHSAYGGNASRLTRRKKENAIMDPEELTFFMEMLTLQDESVRHLWALQLDGWSEILFGVMIYSAYHAREHLSRSLNFLKRHQEELLSTVIDHLGFGEMPHHLLSAQKHAASSLGPNAGLGLGYSNMYSLEQTMRNQSVGMGRSIHVLNDYIGDALKYMSWDEMITRTQQMCHNFETAYAVVAEEKKVEGSLRGSGLFNMVTDNEDIFMEITKPMAGVERPDGSSWNTSQWGAIITLLNLLSYPPDVHATEPHRVFRGPLSAASERETFANALRMLNLQLLELGSRAPLPLHRIYEGVLDFMADMLGDDNTAISLPYKTPRYQFFTEREHTLYEPKEQASIFSVLYPSVRPTPHPKSDEPEPAAASADGGTDAAPDELA